MKRFPLLLSAAAALTLGPLGLAQNASSATHPTGNGNGRPPATAANGGTGGAPTAHGTATASSASGNPASAVAKSNAGTSAATAADGNSNAGGNGNGHAPPKDHTPDPKASAYSNAVQSILQKFDASRDQIVQQRQTLVDKLAAAKDAPERQAAEQELKDEEQTMQAQARATAKEIRAELQAMRRQRTGGGG